MLILSILEHGKFLNLLRSSPIYFFRDLKFLSNISFTSLDNITPGYFILLVTILEGVVSRVSLSCHLSIQRGKTVDFFELILYQATLPKLFISCRSSLVEVLCLLEDTIISPANSDILTSSFLFCITLTYFYCLIGLARTLRTLLNK